MKAETQLQSSYENLIDEYFESLNERDETRRAGLIKKVWAADGVFVSPVGKAENYDAISRLVAGFFEQAPEVRVNRTSAIEVLQDEYLRFGFAAVQPDDLTLFSGTDFAVVKNGKLQYVVGFFNDAPQTAAVNLTGQQIISAAKEMYQAFNNGDLAKWATFHAPDFEWHAADNSPIVDGSPYRGLDTILNEVFPRLGRLFPGMKLRVDEILAFENKAVMLGYYYNLPKKSGGTTEAQVAHVLTFENNKIVKFQQYIDSLKFSTL